MKRVLITGMSGTGKSTAVAAMGEMGYRAVDTDTDEWSEWTGSQIRAMRRDTIQVNTADIHLKSNCGL